MMIHTLLAVSVFTTALSAAPASAQGNQMGNVMLYVIFARFRGPIFYPSLFLFPVRQPPMINYPKHSQDYLVSYECPL